MTRFSPATTVAVAVRAAGASVGVPATAMAVLVAARSGVGVGVAMNAGVSSSSISSSIISTPTQATQAMPMIAGMKISRRARGQRQSANASPPRNTNPLIGS